jgi:hypothetical protein
MRFRVPVVAGFALSAALSLATLRPASAVIPVIDVTAIAKDIEQINQTLMLVTMAQSNLKQLSTGGLNLTNITGRISQATALLQQAEAICQGAMTGRTLPAACNVRANVAAAQAEQLGSAMVSIAGLQRAALGTGGALQAQQTAAHAAVEIATQLQQLHQLSLAEAQQKAIDAQQFRKTITSPPTVNPWK